VPSATELIALLLQSDHPLADEELPGHERLLFERHVTEAADVATQARAGPSRRVVALVELEAVLGPSAPEFLVRVRNEEVRLVSETK
jgi:hypothetical protein